MAGESALKAEQALRGYAAGEVTLADLHRLGFESYLGILGRLGKLGLRPPVAALEGENVDMRRRGRAAIAERVGRP